MKLIPELMLCVFIAAWFIAAAAHFYATRFFMARWLAGFRKRPEHEGYAPLSDRGCP